MYGIASCPCGKRFARRAPNQRYCCSAHRSLFSQHERTRDFKYGPHHRRMRQALQRLVASGQAVCARCGRPVVAGEAWDLGHTPDGVTHSGVEHRYCNRNTAARAAARGDEAPIWSRKWFDPPHVWEGTRCRGEIFLDGRWQPL